MPRRAAQAEHEDEGAMEDYLEPIKRLSRDLKKAAESLSDREARYLVDAYYQIQEWRKAAALQSLSMDKAGEPHSLMDWVIEQAKIIESGIRSALDSYSQGKLTAKWSRSIVGIGPVIAAGLLAHVDSDLDREPYIGNLWAFAGLDPTKKWEPGQKRPWNAKLKVLAWKIGQSFMKFQNHPNDVYGKLYRQRKELEIQRNEEGRFRDQAERALKEKRIGKDTEAYKHYSQGKLPPAHIDARARRWVVKQFLADYWTVAYYVKYGAFPPLPYAFSVLGHRDYRGLPNAHLIPGLAEEIEKAKERIRRGEVRTKYAPQ
jgi:hypothetical protein